MHRNMEKIEGFLKHEHTFLSNFAPSVVELDGDRYHTVEAAYQAAKTESRSERRQFQGLISGGLAKRRGRQLEVRLGWEFMKEGVMLSLLRQKFAVEPMRSKLLATGDAYIEETNWWGDTYWGVFRGAGQNRLGHLLMQVRAELSGDVDPRDPLEAAHAALAKHICDEIDAQVLREITGEKDD